MTQSLGRVATPKKSRAARKTAGAKAGAAKAGSHSVAKPRIGPEGAVRAVLDAAKQLCQEAKLAQAQEMLVPIASVEPTGMAMLLLARIGHRSGDCDATIHWATQVLDRPAFAAEAFLLLGRAHNSKRDWRSSYNAWCGLTEYRAGDANGWLQRARSARRLQDEEEVVHAAEQGLAVEPEMLELWSLAFSARIALRQWGEFPAMTGRLAALDLGLFSQNVLKAESSGQPIAAAECVMAAMAELPDRDEPRQLAAEIASRLVEWANYSLAVGDTAGAALSYKTASKMSPENRQAQNGLSDLVRPLVTGGRQAYREGDWNAAKQNLEQVLEADPEHREANLILARIADAQSDWEKAAVNWAQVARGQPTSANVSRLIRARQRSGDLIGAVTALCEHRQGANADDELADEADKLVRPLLYRVRDQMNANDIPGAIDTVRALLRIDPDHDEGLRRLDRLGRLQLKAAREAYRSGDFGECAQLTENLSTILPHEPDVPLLCARSLMKLRRFTEARKGWMALASLQPDNQDAWLNIARCARHQKDWPAAKGALERLLVIVPDHPEAAMLRESIAAVTDT